MNTAKSGSLAPRFRHACVLALLALLALPMEVAAHGERAQLASMRMRTLHWFDIEVSPTRVNVGDTIVITGKFIPSEFWPEQLPSVEDTAFLNVGAPGPKFIRVHSEVNGVPMIRSTAFEPGKLYEFKSVIRARVAGRYHVHPLINVKDAGTLVGKGTWVDVEPSPTDEPFTNEITTLTGETVDLETVGLKSVIVSSISFGITIRLTCGRHVRAKRARVARQVEPFVVEAIGRHCERPLTPLKDTLSTGLREAGSEPCA